MFAQEPPADPLKLFADWYAEAERSEPNDPNAIALATVGADGMPSVRMVLLKDVDRDGFVFYTNLESRKGAQLQAHPKAAFVLYWKSLKRQIRVEGTITSVTEAEADAYFASRSRGSQIGAWASKQSQPLESRHELEKRAARYGAEFGLERIPRPPHWSGFRIAPRHIEFWREGRFRLHDRLAYTAEADGQWRIERLYP